VVLWNMWYTILKMSHEIIFFLSAYLINTKKLNQTRPKWRECWTKVTRMFASRTGGLCLQNPCESANECKMRAVVVSRWLNQLASCLQWVVLVVNSALCNSLLAMNVGLSHSVSV
jgi:hypothetical protein